MKFSNLKVGTRLMLGFGLLLVACGMIGLIGVQKMGELDAGMQEIATHDWERVKDVNAMEADLRALATSTGELLIADEAERKVISAFMAEKRADVTEAMDALGKLLDEPESVSQHARLAAARAAQKASIEKVESLAGDSKTLEQAIELYQTEALPRVRATLTEVHGLVEMLSEDFELAARQSGEQYESGRRSVFLILGAALAFGIAMAWFLARGIARPLTSAVGVANAIKSGKLDNAITVEGTDEPSQLLEALDAMQAELGRRDAKDADFRGQIAAIHRAQAVIEFDMDGTIRDVNDNFAAVTGYSREEVKGKNHSLFVEPALASSGDYRNFWARLNRGEYDVGTFKRLAKGGREIWLQASYNPILDLDGKPFKVVKFATDLTEQVVKNADFAGQLTAINKTQAVIEFDMDGTVRKINENFARFTGYSEQEVIGRHHSMFLEASASGTAEYRAFWAKLNRGEADIGSYKRVVKGGREVWIQASYNPIPDANGKPFKVVKYANDITASMQQQQQLQQAVAQTQSAVKHASDGDLTHRIPMEGKTGDLETLCRGVNGLLDSTTQLVRQVKNATGEVQQGAEEISKGNTNLSQRTEEQASSLEETASSMEQMTSTVKQTADNAGQANQLAMAARQQAEKGGAVVSSAVSAMSGINDASKKIADIIGVIDEIAFQTNLLALNAAVEGAQSRGPLGDGGQGDQGAHPGQRGPCGAGQPAGGRVGPDARGNRERGEEGDRHRRRDRRGLARAVQRHRAGQQGRDADGHHHAAERRAGRGGRGRQPGHRRAGAGAQRPGGALQRGRCTPRRDGACVGRTPAGTAGGTPFQGPPMVQQACCRQIGRGRRGATAQAAGRGQGRLRVERVLGSPVSARMTASNARSQAVPDDFFARTE
jgi:PAS domain S-box-containing protein